MKLSGLSLQQAPPLSVPFRFFLTAPLFGIASALMMIWMKEDLTASRWSPETLALTHSFLLGFVTSIMLGAQMQMLPVLAGATISKPSQTGLIIHALWTLGVITLIAAFLSGKPFLFQTATLALAVVIALFVFAAGRPLLKSTAKTPSILGMKVALTALVITATWGVIMALGQAGYIPLRRPSGTDIHAMWGLLGWITLLIIAVAYQVIPLFQITNTFPKPVSRVLVPVLFGLMVLRMVFSFFDQKPTSNPGDFYFNRLLIVDLFISAALIIFAATTLYLQHHRRRSIKESHQHFWRVACMGLLATIICWWLAIFLSPPQLELHFKFLCAILYIIAFITPVMIGMLYKITAFLLWFHLQGINTQRTMTGKPPINVPHMKGFISEQRVKIQLYLLVAAQLFTLFTPAFPGMLSTASGAAWLAVFLIMAFNLYSASLKYRYLSNPESDREAVGKQ